MILIIKKKKDSQTKQKKKKNGKAFFSLESCPVTEEAVKEMKEKHPQAPKPTLPLGSLPDAVRFDPDFVRRKVEGFPTGSAAGASGARPQFFMLACPNKAVGDAALSAL